MIPFSIVMVEENLLSLSSKKELDMWSVSMPISSFDEGSALAGPYVNLLVWGVMGVIKAYRLTKFKIAVEGILKVSEGCVEGVWRVSGGV